MNTRLALLGAFVLIIVGFILIKPPTPPIVISAEDIWDLGGYTVTNTIFSFWIIIILLSGLIFLVYRRLRNVEEAIVPRGLQNAVEALAEAFYNVVVLVAGERLGRMFFPVVAGIFFILLFANWFGLFPWNNTIGRTVDIRAEHLEVVEEDAEDAFHDLDALAARGQVGVTDLNRAYGDFYIDPIPFIVDAQDTANTQIAALIDGGLTPREAAVRATFAEDPLPAGAADLPGAIEERFEIALEEYPFSGAELDDLEVDTQLEALEKAIVFNLPLPISEVDETELQAAVASGGGVNIIPIRADDFEYDPYLERVVVTPGPAGAFSSARLYDTTSEDGEDNPPPGATEVTFPFVTLNSTHVGVFLKIEDEGLGDDEGLVHVFPYFRSIATDLNLPLAIALWSFIFVQFWGIRNLGLGNNFGKYLGLGSHAVVKGPIGIAVGLLEVISEISRIVSFTFRLFGNIFAGEIVLFMSAFLVPFVASTVFYGLEVFVGFIQAFVFAMLTLVFGVTAAAHTEHEELEEETAGHEPAHS